MGKKVTDVERKCKSTLHFLTNEEWFTLDIYPKFIVSEFNSRIIIQMTYGAYMLA